MTTARSLAVAQEILSAVVVDSQLNLTLTGARPDMFLNMKEVTETQQVRIMGYNCGIMVVCWWYNGYFHMISDAKY